jgi:hypothetical protein
LITAFPLPVGFWVIVSQDWSELAVHANDWSVALTWTMLLSPAAGAVSAVGVNDNCPNAEPAYAKKNPAAIQFQWARSFTSGALDMRGGRVDLKSLPLVFFTLVLGGRPVRSVTHHESRPFVQAIKWLDR